MGTSLSDLFAHADQLADAFENHDPVPDDFDAPLPPLMGSSCPRSAAPISLFGDPERRDDG